MPVKGVLWANNLALDTEEGPTPALWNWNGQPNGGPLDFMDDPRKGIQFFETFAGAGFAGTAGTATTQQAGQMIAFVGSRATITDASIVGGGISMLPGSSASNEPITIQGSAGAFEIIANSSGASAMQGALVFEARIAVTSVLSGMRDCFVGLAAGSSSPGITFPFTSGTSSNNFTSTNSFIGFYNGYSGSGDWSFVFQGGSSLTVVSNLSNLVSTVTGSSIVPGTYYKLGFVYNPNPFRYLLAPSSIANGQTAGTAYKPILKVYVNGSSAQTFLSQSANILTASFPTGTMYPMLSIMNDVSSVGSSTNAGAMIPDWIRVAQNLIA